MNRTKLSAAQLEVLFNALEYPLFSGSDKTKQSLIKRGLLIECQSPKHHFEITETGAEFWGIEMNEVRLNYARHWLYQDCIQIRHNCRVVSLNFQGEYELRMQWFVGKFDDEVNAVSTWLDRAIELTRAEIRAGIAN